VARTARTLALQALVALERGRSERLRSELEVRGMDPRERALASELAHGVLRRQRLLDHVLLGYAKRGLPKDPQQRVALRLGAYQLLFLPSIKAHAAVHETVGLVVRNNRGFANAVLRRVADSVKNRTATADELTLPDDRAVKLVNALPSDEVARLAIVHSLPDWLAKRFAAEHGIEGLRTIAEAASVAPGIYLRASQGIDAATLQADLQQAEVETTTTDHPRLLRWTGGASPFATEAFEAGHFVVQDPTAMRAAEAVPCEPGDTIIDLCAAPGTKTTLLAERVQPNGKVLAHDIDPKRLARITDNATRLNLTDHIQLVPDATDLPQADCVLADVPCSNTGVLGRRVEARYRLDPATFEDLPKVQSQILTDAIRLTRPGGHIVYSTCSIDREENEAIIAAHPTLELLTSHLTLPVANHHDGGFAATLRRR